MEEAHYKYHDNLKEDTEIEQSELWFDDNQKEYVKTISKVCKFIKTKTISNVVHSEDKCVSMVSMLNAPRIELEPFTGDPLKYKTFLSMFNELVDKTEMSFDSKLSRLIQCTKGEARGSIEKCAISGGESGYNKALTILAERFGNSHFITRSVIRNITEGKNISVKELNQISD